MSKSAFAQAIMAKLDGAIGKDGLSYTSDFAPIAMQAVADAVTEYLKANTTVTVAYSGTLTTTPPSPDPVTQDTFKITGECAPPSPSDNFDSWISEIESNIIACFMLENQGRQGLRFPIQPFANTGIPTLQDDLKAVHDVSDENPQQKVWEVVCGGIMEWINGTAKNPAGGSATRPSGPSTGMAQITGITIT